MDFESEHNYSKTASDFLIHAAESDQARSDFRVADEPKTARAQHLIHGITVRCRPQLVKDWPVSCEETLWIYRSAVEELEYGQGVFQLRLPSLLLSLEHYQVIHEVFSKATQVLVPNVLVIEVLAQVLHSKGKRHANEDRNEFGEK
jgi:hypothetical protein